MNPQFVNNAGRVARNGFITQNGTEASPPWTEITSEERAAWCALADAVLKLNALNVNTLPIPVPYVDRFQTACAAVSNLTPDMGV